jgi:hypothetical protein
VGRRGRGWGGWSGRGWGQGGEMNQALYAHMNNKIKMKKKGKIICCVASRMYDNMRIKNGKWKGWK